MERNLSLPFFLGNHTHTNSTCSRDNVLKTVVFPVLYSLLFLLGLILNSVAAWVFLRIPSKSHFIIYLKNIVVADIIMTFTFPFKVGFLRFKIIYLVLRVFGVLLNRFLQHQLIICICAHCFLGSQNND